MKPLSPFGIPIGLSTLIWSIVGLMRFVHERLFLTKKQVLKGKPRYTKEDIAVIVPAHNEEVVIRRTLQTLKQTFHPKQIYVVSDGSNDKTYRRARMEGTHVSYLTPGRGKAKAMIYLLQYFQIFKRYKLVFIVDADNNIDKTLVDRALRFFDDPDTAVVFSGSKIHWPKHLFPKRKLYFVSYRDRLNRLLVFFYIYGQTWKYTNVNYVIPGFCTIYRSDILSQLEIDTPGLLIEDFNLAFQLHKKKLGKIAYHPSLISWEQYPDNLRDYWKQVRRWNIGFFQTVRINGIWLSFFWFSLALFSFEVILNSIVVVFIPLFLFLWLVPNLSQIHTIFATITQWQQQTGFSINFSLGSLFILFFFIDYLETIIVGLQQKKPQFMMYGLAFFFMHYVTSLILLSSIVPGLFTKSEGKWTSPTRREE